MVIMFGLCSCSNDEENYDNFNGSVHYSSKSQITPANPRNVYDHAGKDHNNLLDKIIVKIRKDYGSVNKPSDAQVYDIIGNVLVAEGLFVNVSNFKSEIPISMLNNILKDTAGLYPKIISSLNISGTSKALIGEMFGDLYLLVGTSDEYIDYKSVIMEKEEEIINTNIAPSEKEKLLIATSIARYSLYYWFNFENSSKSRPIWKYLVVAGADILGGCLSGVGTGVAASGLAVTIVDWNEKPQEPEPPVQDSTTNNN